jgi:hypothetical protein
MSKAALCAALSSPKSAQGAKFSSLKIDRDGDPLVDAVCARTTSRTLTWGCKAPADPMRISVCAP